ncbi:BamA/TamA family outer membrane protein [Phaeobacter sp. PT47_59]|uniref:autotransporter assembly complex protein TamA n=1 Tax=Phaeobacter sp. PT47_59 TaxID=3029979 RepID=UPI002380554F|nr:BamA/TamA family outer membrane protein [Phaeobacter sp. PT47_59]MDE4175501.1 BamA/TamA family outer membrane protein [Phaeobacter sp. PT47_59]
MLPRPRIRSSLSGMAQSLLLCGSVVAGAAQAAETALIAPNAPTDLTARLEDSSAVLASRAGADVQDLLAAALSDYRTLVQVLYDAGHFAPVVTIRLDGREAAGIDPIQPPARIERIEITVTPGPAFTFGTAAVQPWPTASDSALPDGFASGAPASTGVLRDAANAGISAWRQAGHAKAALAGQTITADHRTAQLNARLKIHPGPQLRFGTLTVAGPSDVREEAIRAIAGFPHGEIYHPDDLSRSASRLRRTGSFASVAFREADRANPDGTLDITAQVQDMPPRRLTFGAEMSSTEGASVSASWMHRNLFGAAEKLRIEAKISGIGGSSDMDGRFAMRLDRPATLGPDDNLFYLVEAESLDQEHYTATEAMGGIGLRRVYSQRLSGEAVLGATSILAEDAFGKRRFKYAFANLRAEYDGRDSAQDPTSGRFLSASFTPFFGLEGSDPGARITMDARAYRGFGADDRIVLAGRAQLGSVIGPSHSGVSPTMLFFSGGGGSVRGHEYQSLGVPVAGSTAGGRGYLALSAEVRGRISDKISLVGFYDMAYVDADSIISSDSSSHAGAGLGLRYLVAGIGAIRVDLAYPVSGGSTDGAQIYIGIGQAF